MFGPISDEMFGAIGRVVAVASLVELNAIDLIAQIDCVPQTATAGKSLAALLEQREKAKEPALPSDVVALLGQVMEALDKRNAVAHGLWTVSYDGSTFRWRPVIKRKRKAPHISTLDDTVTIDDMRSLIGCLVDLSSHLKSRPNHGELDPTE